MKLQKVEFLNRNNVSQDSLERSHLSWEELLQIGSDHNNRVQDLSATAEFFVRSMQGCSSIHSVRWRVKSAEHLMEKLIRKTDPESEFYSEKYNNVSVENYYKLVTDLVGVRAIHLFKDQFLEIDEFLCSNWEKQESTTVYKREGDLEDDFDQLQGEDNVIKEHAAGYRSIHYIFKTKPMNREILVEIQVRTIFEEGWSEIDHTVRYPNFSDNELVGYFLKVFNRLAGSADEMGSFVKSLVRELDTSAEEVNKLQSEQDSNIAQINELLAQLEEADGQKENYSKTIAKLKSEVNDLTSKAKPVELRMSDKNSHFIQLVGRTNRNISGSVFSSTDLADTGTKINIIPPKRKK